MISAMSGSHTEMRCFLLSASSTAFEERLRLYVHQLLTVIRLRY